MEIMTIVHFILFHSLGILTDSQPQFQPLQNYKNSFKRTTSMNLPEASSKKFPTFQYFSPKIFEIFK